MQELYFGHTVEEAISNAIAIYRQKHIDSLEVKGWSEKQFVYHFYFGKGRNVTLQQVGLLNHVRQEANRLAINRSDGFKYQILQKIKSTGSGRVYEWFDNSYLFGNVRWVFGDGTLKGKYHGRCQQIDSNHIQYTGVISVQYYDKFVDPFDLIEKLYGHSESSLAPDWLKQATNIGGTPYSLSGHWQENFSGVLNI